MQRRVPPWSHPHFSNRVLHSKASYGRTTSTSLSLPGPRSRRPGGLAELLASDALRVLGAILGHLVPAHRAGVGDQDGAHAHQDHLTRPISSKPLAWWGGGNAAARPPRVLAQLRSSCVEHVERATRSVQKTWPAALAFYKAPLGNAGCRKPGA